MRAYQIASEREHEGRIRDAPVRRWCRVAESAVVEANRHPGRNAGVRPETLGVLVAAAGAFAGRKNLAGDVDALLAAANDSVAADESAFAASASATTHSACSWAGAEQRSGRRREGATRFAHTGSPRFSPSWKPRRARSETALDPQTVRDLVAGADAVARAAHRGGGRRSATRRARLAAARACVSPRRARRRWRARREARDAAHVAASRLWSPGLTRDGRACAASRLGARERRARARRRASAAPGASSKARRCEARARVGAAGARRPRLP